MKNFKLFNKNQGFSLTESLIALVVLSIGLVALVKFQGSLIGSGSLTKARSAATALAQEQIEDLRKKVLESEFTALADTPSTSNGCSNADGFVAAATVTSTNATFTRCYKIATTNQVVSGETVTYKTVTSKLTWTDHTGGAQTVTLNSIISWADPGESAYLAANAPVAGNVTAPTGGARAGGDNDYSGGLPTGPGVTTNGDGTTTYTHDGYSELIDTSTGEVLLTSLQGESFATISGNVYIKGTNGTAETIASNTYVIVSDAGVCNRTIASPILTADSSYSYFSYTCHVGTTWYGNAGIIRTDNPNSNQRVCVGDPAASTNKLSTARTYRGYDTRVDGNGATIVDGNGDPIYYPVGITTGTAYTGHHYLITTITGQASDADCADEMTANSSTAFTGNPNEFYCMTDSCPGTSSSTSIAISGSFTGGTATASSVVTSTGETCTVTTSTYSCSVSYTTGSNWTGNITVTPAAGDLVCSPNPLSLSGLTANSTGNDFTLATGSCSVTTYTISGTVALDNSPGPDTSDLQTTSINVTASAGTANCSYDTAGALTAPYTCTVSSDFAGELTITGATIGGGGGDKVRQGADNGSTNPYSYSSLTGNLTGQNFVITKN